MNTKFRALIAAGAISVVGITGVAGAAIAGAQTTGSSTPTTRARILASLTPEQKTCLKDAGITKPDHKLSKDERQAFIVELKSAAQTCNITLPDAATLKANAQRLKDLRANLKALTPEQKSCLQTNGVAKPDHELTKDERQAWIANLRTAAQTCDITLA